MVFFEDENGQGAAEYILLFGGVIIIAIAALYVYWTYIQGTAPLNAVEDVESVRVSSMQFT